MAHRLPDHAAPPAGEGLRSAPLAFTELLFYLGADCVLYPWWSHGYGTGFGIALVVSLGGGAAAIGLRPVTVMGAAPMVTAEGGVSLSLGASGLFLEVLVTEHLVFDRSLFPMTNLALNLSWAFL